VILNGSAACRLSILVCVSGSVAAAQSVAV
jgi:hypothetical protein